MHAGDGCITYKFRWRFLPYVWLAIFLPFSILLGIAWMGRDSVLGGVVFLMAAVSFVLAVGFLLLLTLSDIEVYEYGIARRAFMHKWQNLRWCDLAKFHVSMSTNPQNGQKVRAFVLVAKPGVAHILSRRITFYEQSPEMLPLLKTINEYVSKHQIPIEDLTVR